jgi:anthranilate phosphoribosyltransferase
MAEVLLRTGSRHALVVYGEDGVDELSLCGPSRVYEVIGGAVREYRFVPEELGLRPVAREALTSPSVEASVELTRSVLGGEPGPARDVVLLNAAGTLLAADVVGDLGEGLRAAASSVDSGAARHCLEELCALSQRLSADVAREAS